MIRDYQLAPPAPLLSKKNTGVCRRGGNRRQSTLSDFLLVSRHLLFINMIPNGSFWHRGCVYLNSVEAFLHRRYSFASVSCFSVGHRKHVLSRRKEKDLFLDLTYDFFENMECRHF